MKYHYFVALLQLIVSAATAQANYQSCSDAYIICSNRTITVQTLASNPNPATVKASCHDLAFPQDHSRWFKCKIKKAGMLSFTILPLNNLDDIDFIVYQLEEDKLDCKIDKELRCVASGDNLGNPSDPLKCTGATGLAPNVKASAMRSGCSNSNGTYASSIPVFEGQTFALLVNNFKSENGFILEFTGDAIFETGLPNCSDVNTGSDLSDLLQGFSVSSAYPNPTSAEVSIDLLSDRAGTVDCCLINSFGEVLQQKFVPFEGGNTKISFAVNSLTSGAYFIKARFSDGTAKISRFVK